VGIYTVTSVPSSCNPSQRLVPLKDVKYEGDLEMVSVQMWMLKDWILGGNKNG